MEAADLEAAFAAALDTRHGKTWARRCALRCMDTMRCSKSSSEMVVTLGRRASTASSERVRLNREKEEKDDEGDDEEDDEDAHRTSGPSTAPNVTAGLIEARLVSTGMVWRRGRVDSALQTFDVAFLVCNPFAVALLLQ